MSESFVFQFFTTLIRYALVALATYFATMGYFEDTLVDALASLGTVIFTGVWMILERFWYPKRKRRKYRDPNKEFNGGYEGDVF